MSQLPAALPPHRPAARHRLALLVSLAAGAAAAGLEACASLRPGPPRAVAPRPMAWACPNVAPAAFAAQAIAALRETGWTLREADSTRGAVRATRGPVYAGLGENLTADGPYLMALAHDGREARAVVQVVETYRHRVVPVENLDDGADDADRRNFLPVVDRLRRLCGAPTSGRTPPPRPRDTLPPRRE